MAGLPWNIKLMLNVGAEGSLAIGSVRPHPSALEISTNKEVIYTGLTKEQCDERNCRCLDALEACLAECSSCKELTVRTHPSETSNSIVDRLCEVIVAWRHNISSLAFTFAHQRVLSIIFSRMSQHMGSWKCKKNSLIEVDFGGDMVDGVGWC